MEQAIKLRRDPEARRAYLSVVMHHTLRHRQASCPPTDHFEAPTLTGETFHGSKRALAEEPAFFGLAGTEVNGAGIGHLSHGLSAIGDTPLRKLL